MARPRKLNDTKQDMVVALISAGVRMKRIAEHAGCSLDTIYRLRKSNKEFDERVRQAQLTSDLRPLEAMRRASQTHWRAAAWMLDREDRRERGKAGTTVRASVAGAEKLTMELVSMIRREVDQRDMALSQRLEDQTRQIISLWATVPQNKRAA